MATTRRIRSKVIVINADTYSMTSSCHTSDSFRLPTTGTNGPRFRPSDLVPWADPYIAELVHGLQEEVRQEQAEMIWGDRAKASPSSDLEWTWEDTASDYEPTDRESEFELPVETTRFGAEDFA